ncbi:MAG: thioredoxin [Actinobacteria bacterium]|nr:thioredoxin [Actinomycetota bacterium]
MSMPQLPNNFGRAYDLSSLGKPKSAPSQQGDINEATVDNLMADFVQKSKEIPVVLLAYSDRSAITTELRDLMAKIAQADNGTWKFGAINVDAQPQLVQALQIQSVPFAIAFVAEKPVALFDRPLPEDQIKLVLAKLFELAKEQGLNVQVPEIQEPPMEPEEEAALSALEKGDYSGAAMAYRNWLQRKPGEVLAEIGLAQCELMLRISTLDPVRTIKSANEKPDSLQDQMMAADIEVAQGLYRQAFDRLLAVMKRVSGDEKNKAKEHLLALFKLVDPRHPDLIQARKELASALF